MLNKGLDYSNICFHEAEYLCHRVILNVIYYRALLVVGFFNLQTLYFCNLFPFISAYKLVISFLSLSASYHTLLNSANSEECNQDADSFQKLLLDL